jgi:Phosphotransferase enzyme family
VLSLDHVEGRGYTHAGRHRAVLDDGRSVFVKSAVDELSAGWLRLEHVVYANVQGPFLARFQAYDETDGWPLLVLEDLSGSHMPPPWREGDVAAVRAALELVATTEAPDGLTPIHAWKEDWLSRWRKVEDDPRPFLSTGVASAAWLEEHLPALEAAAARAPLEEGSSLLHLDVRSDNIALTERGAVLFDWNWASQGNPLIDLVAWAPSLCIETGVRPEQVVDDEGAGELAALVCGIWAQASGLPPPPTATARLRATQLAHLRICLPWTCRALGIPEPV